MLLLSEIKPRDLIKGVIPNSIVEVINVKSHGSDVLQITYREYEKQDTRPDDTLLYKDDEIRLEKITSEKSTKFDANGKHFRLVSEAYRIHLAYVFDPRLAVNISMVDPFPHQLIAVYENMRPLQPLRFCLADDPGAGKTIMAGLYLKEMILREDVKRCLIVSPGNLVEQWQEEMFEKFHLSFELMSKEKYETSATGNPLDDNNFVISRLDQMSRSEEIQQRLLNAREWDLIIVDEAHKMAAHAYGNKLDKTKRYILGELLSSRTKHFLLLTATPHNGKEGDFQAFMGLLDQDRFAGTYRQKDHKKDYSGLLRRVVKEEMKKFDGTKLFPPREAYTVKYQLSEAEQNLYETVTNYVRNQFNKATRLSEGRRNVIGFALTVLQRRLASSPEAIFSSLVNRRKRLQERVELAKSAGVTGTLQDKDGLLTLTEEEIEEISEDDTEEERLEAEDEVVDRASAAQTIAELEDEIRILDGLCKEAKKVRDAGTDKKWNEVKKVIVEKNILSNPSGPSRKLIIFTEHLATLNYLVQKLQSLIGKKEAVVWIHGKIDRVKRRYYQNQFIHDKNVQILVATDAAGEGINLQRANLMINYDIPWNLNRIEQRFGRIHRIKQQENCYLWNLVAEGTREGDVLLLLLQKLEIQREALGEKVYNVIGNIYEGDSLKKIILKAIIAGDDPKVKEELRKAVENPLDTERIKELLEKYALVRDALDTRQIEKAREELELSDAKKLQPHFISEFFIEAFRDLGASIKEREPKRYEISNVPSQIRGIAEKRNDRQRIQSRYERITFEKELMDLEGLPHAEFVCPGRPLLDSVIKIILDKYENLFKIGATLVDPRDPSCESHVLFYVVNSIFDATRDRDGNPHQILKQLNFISIKENGEPYTSGPAAYLDYRPPTEDEQKIISSNIDFAWINEETEDKCRMFANAVLIKKELDEMKKYTDETVEKIKSQVNDRLTKEIIYQSNKAQELKMIELRGKINPRMNSGKAMQIVEDLKERLENKMKTLDDQKLLRAGQATIIGRVLVIPAGFLEQHGMKQSDYSLDGRDEIENIAMRQVMEQEKRLGRIPQDVTDQNLPYDIVSKVGNGKIKLIEVKGKLKGKPTITVSKNEILTYKNKPDDYILAIVMVNEDRTPDKPLYVFNPFELEPGIGTKGLAVGFNEVSTNYDLKKLLKHSVEPQ